MNKVILMGRVGQDPRMRFVGDRPLAEFSLATSERPKGSDVELTEWHNIVMWDKAAEFAEKYVRKGARMLIEGKLRTRFWEDHNALKQRITEIYVETFELLPR